MAGQWTASLSMPNCHEQLEKPKVKTRRVWKSDGGETTNADDGLELINGYTKISRS